MAGKPPQALEQPTMCSCPPRQGGSREKSSSFFSFPIHVAPAIPSPDKPGGWAACFPGSGEYKQGHHGNPQSVHDIATGTKLFQVQKQNPDPFMPAVEALARDTSPEPHTLGTLGLGPKTEGVGEERSVQPVPISHIPAPRRHRRHEDTQVSKRECPRILGKTQLLSHLGKTRHGAKAQGQR